MKQITIAGNIGKDAELRTTQNGDKVAGFPVAVSGFRKSDPSLWFDCSIWGKRGEKTVDYIRKGGKITVTGEFGTREHNDKTYLTIRVSDFTLQGGSEARTAASRENMGQDAYRDKTPASGALDDDFDTIPF